MKTTARPVGDLLRDWRRRRRMSQLDLACEAGISTRHLSFMETGRSFPSRDMVLHLADRLDVPLRERNLLLLAAGYAPVYSERRLDDPALAPARRAVDLLLAGHEPYPALAVDRRWTLVAANAAVAPLLAGIEAALLEPPTNVLRLSLHPAGLAPRIVNYREWRAHLLERLRRQIDATGDPGLARLAAELEGYPPPDAAAASGGGEDYGGVLVPLRLASPGGVLSFFSTTPVFGTPMDVTLSELVLESFFPADETTAAFMRGMVPSASRVEATA
jgi:transcriptional regulator with XRE-family HTH domain